MPYYSKHTTGYIEGTIGQIKDKIYLPLNNLSAEVWITKEPVSFDNKTTGEKKIINVGEKWGELWDCAWFHFQGDISEKACGHKVVLLIDLNGEGCVFDDSGCPVRGLTNVNSEFDLNLGMPGKRVLQFCEESNGNETVDMWIEAGCNDLFGYYRGGGSLRQACFAICDESLRKLYYDFFILFNLSKSISDKSARYARIISALNKASNCLIDYTKAEIKEADDIVSIELAKKGGTPSFELSAIGHAHIDLAWLWPIRETIRKGSRTFSTAIELMDRYPEYIFGASQPQLYQWIKEYYPKLYKKISDKIQEGRWEAQGAMWVEPDTNVTSGESLVRQILYGKRFFKKEFDKDMKILWLPDVFGYSAALPQILKKSGVDYFMTIKLSWSEHNTFPHNTFYWQGIDGTKILSHMPPNGTYNDPVTPQFIKSAEEKYLDKSVSDSALVLYGIGDGGGGPGAEHLERLARVKSIEGLSPVKQESALKFFERLENNKSSVEYKTWQGELYLEKHQGTYTTQSKTKCFNRKMEFLLRELEFSEVLAQNLCNTKYPQAEIESMWKEILLYQFHDILPGSSIKRVYDEALERYEILYNQATDMLDKVNKEIASHIKIDENSNIVAFNSLSWERIETIKFENKWIDVKLPALGFAIIDINREALPDGSLKVSKNTMENKYLKVEFEENGHIKSIYDKQYNKEIVESSANVLSLYEDDGNAWDIMINYSEKTPHEFKLLETKISIDGFEAIALQKYIHGDSTLIQKIVLNSGSRRIDFVTEVEWHEKNRMLRASFPVNIFTDNVTSDIQFGSIKRSTNDNTSWDMAKFEICANKWVDLSNRDYGVALLNDSKYGHKVKGNVLDINLLRSTNYPGAEADIGNHKFVYSLYPHAGDEVAGEVMQQAYELNIPVRFIATENKDSLYGSMSIADISNKNIIVESIKKAEDSNDIILRLYESSGCYNETNLNINLNYKTIELVNLIEENPIAIEQEKLRLQFSPFEIKTVKVIM